MDLVAPIIACFQFEFAGRIIIGNLLLVFQECSKITDIWCNDLGLGN